MSTVLIHGMEHSPNNTLSFLIDQTTIKLTKGCICDADSKVDLMVVGRVQQRKLRKPNFEGNSNVGVIRKVAKNRIFIKNKDDDSSSDDDGYTPFSYIGSFWEPILNEVIETDVVTKIMTNKVLSVIEPYICMGASGGPARGRWSYVANRKDGSFVSLSVHDKKKVIEEAKKDLAVCYKNVLCKGLGIQKSIALSAFGTDVGIPREEAASVAVSTIIEFIKSSVNDTREPYALIYLFVKKRSDFARYKELLAAYGVEQK